MRYAVSAVCPSGTDRALQGMRRHVGGPRGGSPVALAWAILADVSGVTLALPADPGMGWAGGGEGVFIPREEALGDAE